MRTAAVLCLLAACSSPSARAADGGTRKEAAVQANVITIQETTNFRLGAGLEVSAGNFWEETYRDGSGQERTGLTCGLWIAEPGHKERRHLRVHPGEQVQAAGHTLRVVDVRREGERGRVVLEVTPPPAR